MASTEVGTEGGFIDFDMMGTGNGAMGGFAGMDGMETMTGLDFDFNFGSGMGDNAYMGPNEDEFLNSIFDMNTDGDTGNNSLSKVFEA